MHKLVTALVVEVVCTQLLIRFVAGEPMERTHDNGADDDHDGSFLPLTRTKNPLAYLYVRNTIPMPLCLGGLGKDW